MQQVLDYLNSDLVHNSLVIQVLLTIFLTLITSAFCAKFLDKLHKRATRNHRNWDDIILVSLKQPVRLLIYIIGFSFALELLGKKLNIEILSAISGIKAVLIIFIAMSFVLKLIKSYEETSRASSQDANSANIIARLLRASVYITVALILMQSFGINISGLLAFGGVGGLAIGFAAQDLLANFFGAIMIYMDKPFKVGDTIDSPDKTILGTVESIGWRLTVVRNFDQRPVYIPNALFSSIIVINTSRMTNRKIDEVIGIRYQDISQLEKIVDKIKENLKNSDLLDHDQSLIVNLSQYGDFSVNIKIYCFTKTVDWTKYHADKQLILLDIAAIIAKHKADFAFPTQTLHIDKAA
ncbi:MAG: mechanosensitive ion channel family protein [Rickettsiales bacterium]|jgi:MscS family membrane protein|nr:mechanosensitive ion channel family protein [Rickettsiales bacterium]